MNDDWLITRSSHLTTKYHQRGGPVMGLKAKSAKRHNTSCAMRVHTLTRDMLKVVQLLANIVSDQKFLQA
jgi:hypothetical protein